MSTIANSDLPNDNNACTTDTCSAGTPTYTNVAIDTACGTGDFCNGAGSCVDCTAASQCGTSTFCQTFTCSTAARKSDPSLRMTEIEVCGGGFRGDESWAEGADNVHPFA
jgi:hypothetical protein